MARPAQFPRWSDVDPSVTVVEPPESKKNVGWVKEEKPPARFFNWLFYTIYQWIVWLTAQLGSDDLRSNNPVRWTGTQILFSAPIQIIFREEASIKINQIPSGSSPISLSDGQVLVVFPDKTSASPVTLTAGTYGTLAAGQYAVVNESSLTANNSENELILFRRRDVDAGSEEYGVGYAALEIPLTNQMIFPNSRFYLGGKDFDGKKVYDGDKIEFYSDNGTTKTLEINGTDGTVDGIDISEAICPIGTIVAFYDFGAPTPLTFNSQFWAFCNGQVVSGGPLDGKTLPDLSNRYLVGLGAENGGDIGSATFSAVPVGNASHNVSFSHTHTIPAHSHTVNSHTHSLPSHTHSISADGSHSHGGLTGIISSNTGFTGNDYAIMDDDGFVKTGHHTPVDGSTSNFEGQHRHILSADGSHSHGGSTGSGGSGTSGAASPGTNSTALTSNSSLGTISIQPRSVPVRWIMRKK